MTLGLERDRILKVQLPARIGKYELEEFLGDLHAHQVRDAVVVVGRARAVAEVAGERRIAARTQLATENVFLRFHAAAMWRFSSSTSGSITS